MSTGKFVLALLRRNDSARSFSSFKRNLFETRRTVHVSAQNKFRFDDVNNADAKLSTNEKPDWNKAVSEAEKIVGYPTSYLSLRWLLSDEIANVALHLRKLVGSNHPLLKTAKSLIYNGRNDTQALGLIVLLISKAAGHLNVDDMEEDKAVGVLHSQRALAEVTEMMRMSILVHKGMVDLNGVPTDDPEFKDMSFGNKIALLSGDYLLSQSSLELSALRNQYVIELMSTAVKDMSEAEFLGRRDADNNPLPAIPPEDRRGYAVREWTLKSILSAGSLLGGACKCTLLLAGHDSKMQEQGYNFGKHLALAWQACLDLGPFIDKNKTTPFNLCSAPIMFHIEHDPSILLEIDKGLESIHNVDYAKIYNIVMTGPGIELTKQLQKEHSQKALEVLNVFQESDARSALYNIIAAMGDYE